MKRKTRSLYAHGCWVTIARPSRTGSFESAKWYNPTNASRARIARFIMANKKQATYFDGIQWHEPQ